MHTNVWKCFRWSPKPTSAWEVITYTQDCNDKVHTFLSDNNFCTVPKYPTNHDHRTIQKTLQHCDKIIDKKQIKFLTQKTPTPPTLNALLKLHKPNTHIRPAVNNKNTPTHKTARRLNTILNYHLHLDKLYNTINSNTLANGLVSLKIKAEIDYWHWASRTSMLTFPYKKP